MHRFTFRGAKGSIPGVSDILAPLLIARGADTPEAAQSFLYPAESDLADPFLIQGMERACALIRDAIAAHAPIVVYGDYDCDGVCASALLWETLRDLGAQARVYIPDRQAEGYGLNAVAIRGLARAGGLLITVDCGVTGQTEIALAQELGMRVIVTDHHTLPDPLPGADALLHPTLGDFPCKNLCGAGLAYKLCCALTGQQILPCLELAGLATVADMVPLLGENRTLAALGLKMMRQTARPGLRALLRVAGLDGQEEISGTQAAFLLAPRINACGRMASARIALELLTSRDTERADELADEAERLNARRRNIEQHILEEAEEQVRAMDLCRLRAIVVSGENWESGVVGLVAGRLAERYGYPAVALSKQGEKSVGSARSACGVDLYQALCGCGDLFERFGGHKQAAGLTIKSDLTDELRERLSQAVETQLQGRALMPETAYDGELTLEEINLAMIDELHRLEPCGMGNPAPVFLVRDAQVLAARAVGADGAHLKLTLLQGDTLMDAIAFGMGQRAGMLTGACDLAITPVSNTFRGKTSAECRVEAIGAAQACFRSDKTAEMKAVLQEFSRFWRNNKGYAVNSVAKIPAPAGTQGTLYLCRSAETAQRVAAAYPDLDVLAGAKADPRAYNALWYCGELAARGPYRRVVLCDGLLCPQEAGILHELYPQAELMALPESGAMRACREGLRFSVDELRMLYRALRAGRQPDMQDARTAAMAQVLMALELISPELQLLPMRKCDPAAHPLYRLIQGSEL